MNTDSNVTMNVKMSNKIFADMKFRLFLIIGMLLSSNFVNGQISQYQAIIVPHRYTPAILDSANVRITYSESFVIDSSKMEERYHDRKILLVGDSIQYFYSYYRWQSDSMAGKQNQSFKPLKFSPEILPESYYVFTNKNKNERYVVEWIRQLIIYCYKESADSQQWIIEEDTAQILSFNCQKATCRFRGRNWTAWFSSEIPISAGPWKLTGLPGLILKAYDDRNHYIFECIGVENLRSRKEVIGIMKELQGGGNTREQYREAQKNFYDNYVNALLSLGYYVYISDDTGKNIEKLEPTNKSFENKNMSFWTTVYYKDRYRKIPYNPIELE